MGVYKYIDIFLCGGIHDPKGYTNILIYLYARAFKYINIFVWGHTNILIYLYGGIQSLGVYKYFTTSAREPVQTA